MVWYLIALLVSIGALSLAIWLYYWVAGQPSSNKTIGEIGLLIQKGAKTFLTREYKILAIFCAIAGALIFLFLPKPIWSGGVIDNIKMTLSYFAGSVLSAVAGKIGITVATIANVKSAEAATSGIRKSFMIGFRGGAVMGMAVVGTSLMGVAAVLYLTGDASTLLGFSFGASSVALFAKAGGGIFTKSADISADLVGKVELGIPEDDPRNPAVIADNVGDNVGDVAGMGADLFDSNVASMAAAMVLAMAIDGGNGINSQMVLCYSSLGLISSMIGIIFGKIGKKGDPSTALNRSTYITTLVFAFLSAIATYLFKFEWRYFFATAVGLLVGTIIGLATDYFTNDDKKPVKNVAASSESGPAFTILNGINYGFMSVLPSMVGIGLSSLIAFFLCYGNGSVTEAFFGIAMSAVGMLSIVGMIISNDAYGPIVDNARGLVEMGNLGDEALEVTDKLDSAGNTVKAITKGFAIGAAGLTVIALLGAYLTEVNVIITEFNKTLVELGKPAKELIVGFDILNPTVFFGLMIGVTIPAVFSAMLMFGVERNARRMVAEIHRQFDDIPGLKEGTPGVLPEYDRCIDIATKGSLQELIPAGLMAIIVTLAVGFIGGVTAIGGYITGNILSGLLLALFMGNAGGLWDNAKKYVEAGNNGGKGSVAHKAAVVGDTVGDPFKDTAGPSINTQITVISLVASLAAWLFVAYSLIG